MKKKFLTIVAICLAISATLAYPIGFAASGFGKATKTVAATDVITVVSPVQAAEINLDNDRIADYFANYTKGYSVSAGYFGKGDIFQMKPVTIEWTCEDGKYYQLFIADNAGFQNAEIFVTVKNSVIIENLIPGVKYFWKVRVTSQNDEEKDSKTYCFTTKGNVRTITIDGVSNSRDLGGIKTADGKTVRYGMIYRSANLDSVT